MCRTITARKPSADDTRHGPVKRAAQDPGVREFEAIVCDAKALRRRVAAFLEEHDGETLSPSMVLLEAANRSETWEENLVPELLRHLWAIHYVLEAAGTNIETNLVPSVFPRVFTS